MNNESTISLPKYQYTLRSAQTESVHYPFTSLEDITTELGSGYIVLWQYHSIFVGKVEHGLVRWLSTKGEQPENEQKHIVRLRAFNEDREYHIWRSDDRLEGRLREDKVIGRSNMETEAIPTVDTCMVLRGVVGELLASSREFENMEKLHIQTRNYVGYNDIGQAGYEDSRFVSIKTDKTI
jgi:hypothetical protein